MAFGTGHHATTSGIIKLMNGIDFNGKSVFDYGCGTGILAILAEKMGAKHIEAIDIEEEAVANSLENFKINNCKKIQVSKGDLSVVENKFDVIIANINRNVILASIPTLVSLLNPEGLLFTSGFLNIDYQLIKSSLEENHFLELECSENNAWLCILAKKVN